MVNLLNPSFSITGSFKHNHRWLPLVTDQASKNRRSRQFIVQKHERVHARRFATGGRANGSVIAVMHFQITLPAGRSFL